MRSTSASPRLIWTVLCAVWLAALAPSVSELLASQQRNWVEVCTSAGAQWRVQSSAPGRKDGHPAAHRHCPYCLLQQDQATPPAAFSLDLVALSAPGHQPWPVHARPIQAVAWVHLPSRAPPTSLV